MNEQQYIEHEVQIRVLKETTDCKFTMMQKNIDDRFSHVEYKINLLIGLAIGSLIIPLIKIAMGII
jgi:hypothetical protein